MKRAFCVAAGAALFAACIGNPRGRCASDADCAAGEAGSFCAESVCQGPPRAVVEDAPVAPLSRAQTATLHVRVDRAHGGAASATARFEAGALRGPGVREADGRLRLDVPVSFAPAGAEGPAALAVVVADDLGHELRLAATLNVDDLAPRISVDPASVPAQPVIRGAVVSLRVALADASPSTLRYSVGAHPEVDALRNADGSFQLAVDTRLADPGSGIASIVLRAVDSVGNSRQATLQIQSARQRWKLTVNSSPVQSLAVGSTAVWAVTKGGTAMRTTRDGASSRTLQIGQGAIYDATSDGERLFVERVDNQVCELDSNGVVWCCGPFGTLRESPALAMLPRGAAIVPTVVLATAGNASTGGLRFHAVRDRADATGCDSVGSIQLASFDQGAPSIGADGIVYAGATGALVAGRFDGFGWSTTVATRTERFVSQAALGAPAAAGQVALLATDTGLLEWFLFPPPPSAGALPGTPVAGPSIQPSASSLFLTGATIGAGNRIVLGTHDPLAIALDGTTGAVLWKAALPGLPTTPPTQGADGAVYVPTDDGSLTALALADGRVLWSFAAGAAIRTPPAVGCDATLYFGTDAGDLFALAVDAPGLAATTWPRAGHDIRGTGDAGRPLRAIDGSCLE